MYGLYSALQLLSLKPYHIHVVEKNNHLGGRIKTKVKKSENIYYEHGADRFNANHKLLLKLETVEKIKPLL
jgi:predicted NAD/FAD-dependent oxidoreductase